jgi:hypothetical protein
MMEAVLISETSVCFKKTVQGYVPEGCHQVKSKSPLTSLVLVNICGILSVLYVKCVNVGVRTLLELILRRQIVRSKLY